MSKTKLFIEKARAVHGDLYGYDRVVYVRAHDKVTITCKQHGGFEQVPNNHLNGQGCAKCGLESTSAKKTQKASDSFIEKARAVHGNRYDYKRVVYVRSRDKVIITCKEHGEFEQIPANHLSGHGCARCGKESMAIKQSEESKNSFIARARTAHGDLYDYGRAVYVEARDKVIITCKKHGDFEQTPHNHLNGSGCAKCAGSHRYSTQEWIQEAVAVHGDRYGYGRVVYVRKREKVIITCKIHGDFEQEPSSHLRGSGCAKCGSEEAATKISQEAKDSFIGKSRAAHGDRYDYSKTVYVRNSDKVIITCKKHGDFEQAPHSHLAGRGCPSCPKRRDLPTNLYLMHNGLGKVKVGYSIDANRRITELNRDAPFEAELLETWTLTDTPTALKIESKVHRKLAKYHAGLSGFEGATEWFNASPDTAKKHILDAIRGSYVVKNYVKNNPQMSLI